MIRFRVHGQLVLLVLALAIFLLAGCSRRPLEQVHSEASPIFIDDLDRDSLKQAIRSNLEYLAKQPSDKTFLIADLTVPVNRLQHSLQHFLDILSTNPSPGKLNRLIREQYDIYQATGTEGFNPGRKMLITAYFQPVLTGSLDRKAPYLYPLYSVPDDLKRTKGADGGATVFSRRANGREVPYWTREEIEKEGKAAGHELVWLKDPFDAFVLHVQGSGLIRLEDGTVRGVHYAAKNGRPYRSIGKYMVETGRISLEKAGLASIREYLARHPEERDEILHHNTSFIFFDWTESQGAIGNLGRELTAGRSIAVDQNCFPAGGLAFLMTRKPVRTNGKNVGWTPLRRFVLVQDTGSAIRGPGRVDLFWGTGDEAGFEAGQMKENGTMYFLLLKEEKLAKVAQR